MSRSELHIKVFVTSNEHEPIIQMDVNEGYMTYWTDTTVSAINLPDMYEAALRFMQEFWKAEDAVDEFLHSLEEEEDE